MKNQGIKLYNRAKKIIPSGTMLYSKKPELYLPDYWPTYFSKSKGCYLWDIQGKKYVDMLFLVGTNTLGYNNQNIDGEVKKSINKGNMTSLNCKEEIDLAQLLVKLHPWADQVKFTRGGGEANAAAIRIARASTKKQNIAFCGYHGWHDWYLSSNINNKNNLNNHLMSNLKFRGVSKSLKNTSFPFMYNDLEGLKKLINSKNIGIIIMEVLRNSIPKNNFLKEVRKICNKKNIILIFDECTSGFRESLGGKHMEYRVYPDLAMFGKAIGNGYAINAIIGKKKFMINSEKTFISSTFWTERLGSVAALATIKYMKKNKSYKFIKGQGLKIKSMWNKIATKHNIEIDIISMDSIPIFVFKEHHNLKKTFLTQEMLKSNILASNIIYLSISHTDKILKKYFKKLDIIFKIISELSINKLKKKIDGRESYIPMNRVN
jgi:glutamate-1-semialdehyde 2,1-aminomutase